VSVQTYKKVQAIAKMVHKELGDFIDSNSSEKTIAEKAEELLAKQGVTDTWYHGVPAFVLTGSRSCLSISGKDYQASLEKVGQTNLVTVDLSPMVGNVWGDCARSYFIENGKCTQNPQTKEFQQGRETEMSLHQAMKEFVSPNTLFSELFEFGNRRISELGYVNLDFLGNLGHSIEASRAERRFIDQNCNETLGSVKFFTFEPHIRKVAGRWGFKHENIYYFDKGGVVEL